MNELKSFVLCNMEVQLRFLCGIVKIFYLFNQPILFQSLINITWVNQYILATLYFSSLLVKLTSS